MLLEHAALEILLSMSIIRIYRYQIHGIEYFIK